MAWVSGKVVSRHEWSPGLITLGLDTVVKPVAAGQFVNLALDGEEGRIKRSYSLASAPGQPCEFYLTHVPGGALTTGLVRLRPGDSVWVDDRALGFFTLDRVPNAEHVWLLATGTGLGPFMAMLRDPNIWQRFARIVVVHGVRQVAHLGYAGELAALARERPEQLCYVPLITREAAPEGGLAGRLPLAIRSGELERRVGLSLSPQTSQVLMCGNPAMIVEATQALAERGLEKHRAKKPGHITLESYW